MIAFGQQLKHSSQAISYFLGMLVIGATFLTFLMSWEIEQVGHWIIDMLGFGFMSLLSILIILCLVSLINILNSGADHKRREIWLETGIQSANGVTTLALTYTLYGISVGIGSLASQELTPDTVQTVIRELTSNFSLAFMTTVLGLPASALLRALILVAYKQGYYSNQFNDNGE